MKWMKTKEPSSTNQNEGDAMRKPGAAEIDACRRPTSVWVALGRSPASSPDHPEASPKEIM